MSKGYFTGRYDLTPISNADCKRRGLPCHWWSRPLFDFILDPLDPLTYHRGTFEAQPCARFVTDGGSIPALVQMLPCFDRFRYIRAYGFHDSAYKKHLWWTRQVTESTFRKTTLTRRQADLWLREMIEVDGAWHATAATVYAAVRAGGWAAW